MFSLGVTLAELLTGAWVEDSADVTGPRRVAVSASTWILPPAPRRQPRGAALPRVPSCAPAPAAPPAQAPAPQGPLPLGRRIEKQLALGLVLPAERERAPPARRHARGSRCAGL